MQVSSSQIFESLTRAYVRLLSEGNANSGNYGHAGIPGQRGGSVARGGVDGTSSFHATTKRALKGILKDGVVPNAGSGLVTGRGGKNDYITGDREGTSFVTTSEEDAKEYGNMLASSSHFCEEFVVLKIVLPKGTKLTYDQLDAKRHGLKHSYMVKGSIDRKWIKGYSVYTKDKQHLSSVELTEKLNDVLYVPVAIIRKKEDVESSIRRSLTKLKNTQRSVEVKQ